MTYASGTNVSQNRSREELQSLLERRGCQEFGYFSKAGGAQQIVGFKIGDVPVQFSLPMPSQDDRLFWFGPKGGRKRTKEQATKAWEQACRARWRACVLVVKAKLEAVDCGISTLEEEFLAWIRTAGGSTVYEVLRPKLEAARASGQLLLEG